MTIQTEKYARKPFYVDAVQVTRENIEEVAKWCMGDIRTQEQGPENESDLYIKVRVYRPLTPRQTQAFPGDWVLYAGTGYKVFTDKAFRQSFERPAEQSDSTSELDTPLFSEASNS